MTAVRSTLYSATAASRYGGCDGLGSRPPERAVERVRPGGHVRFSRVGRSRLTDDGEHRADWRRRAFHRPRGRRRGTATRFTPENGAPRPPVSRPMSGLFPLRTCSSITRPHNRSVRRAARVPVSPPAAPGTYPVGTGAPALHRSISCGHAFSAGNERPCCFRLCQIDTGGSFLKAEI